MKFSLPGTTFLLIMVAGFSSAHAASVTLIATLAHRVETQLPLNGITISAGPDLPVGTVLYQGFLRNNQGGDHPNITFSTNWDGGTEGTYSVDTKITYSTSNINLIDSTKKIYSTNIPGVGVQYISGSDPDNVVTSGEVINTNTFGPYGHGGLPISWNTGWDEYNIRFRLIKTGAISPGMFIGNSLGRVTITQYIEPGHKGTIIPLIVNGKIDIAWFNFTGSINITVPSCQTPANYTVDLKKHLVSDLYSKGYTEWYDSSINLTDCPTFYGNPGAHDNIWDSDWGNGNGVPDTMSPNQNNTLGLTLNGNSGNTDAGNGIISIDNSVAGSAKGVAIQIARGTPSSNVPVSLGQEFSLSLLMDGRSTIKIPLVARIIKLDEHLLPGSVQGKATYVINYK